MNAIAPRAAAVALLLAACSCLGACEPDPRSLSWTIAFASGGDRTGAASVEARILRGGCGATAVAYATSILPGSRNVPAPPSLPPGTYGFSARALDARCVIIAEGCTRVALPLAGGAVSVSLASSGAAARACDTATCRAGQCPIPDGGVPADGGRSDACRPSAELCNGLDDDCNGLVDDGVDTTSDPMSCGACGNVCPGAPGASATCTMATCGFRCSAGRGDCDRVQSNGCEADLMGDPDHCSTCDASCPAGGHAAATCTLGSCGLACDPGYDDCDHLAGSGCERAIGTLTDCGACGAACDLANASERCAAGACELVVCDAGWSDCDAMPANGCESNVSTDPANCGVCGHRCALPRGLAACIGRTCSTTVASCETGWGNCNGMDADGCETTLATLTDCGRCGAACTVAHGTPTCASGTCDVAGCDAGFGNCDSNGSNGCEARLDADPNCGSCGASCSALPHASGVCRVGGCELTGCAGGFADCNRAPGDGCETDVTSNPGACGGCGVACTAPHAVFACVGGACQSSIAGCDSGWGNCNGVDADGCETDVTTIDHCGGCGSVCRVANGTPACVSGSCTIAACDELYGNCDRNYTTGCEHYLDDQFNCGTCGSMCPVGSGCGVTCGPPCTASCSGV